MKVEITVNDSLGNAGVILSINEEEQREVSVKIAEGLTHAEVSLEDLKAALRKLSAK